VQPEPLSEAADDVQPELVSEDDPAVMQPEPLVEDEGDDDLDDLGEERLLGDELDELLAVDGLDLLSERKMHGELPLGQEDDVECDLDDLGEERLLGDELDELLLLLEDDDELVLLLDVESLSP